MRLCACAIGWILLLCFAADANASKVVDATSGAPRAASYVQPIDMAVLTQRFQALPKRDREIIRLYQEAARRYVLTLEDGVFPNAGSEHWRNIAERAHGAAFLAAIPGGWPEELRDRCRRESAGFVREFVGQYKDRNDLGNPWQCSWWAGEMGAAAWFLWDLLDAELRRDVAEMVVFHADRVAAQTPGARVVNDTEAETVAWNSTILSLAVNMMPAHPHHAVWDEAAKHYVYTILGVSADLEDNTPGDDGRPVKAWVAGANLHDDFSLENHGRFHIDYLLTTYRFMTQGAALYHIAGNPLPQAFTHHAADVYEQVFLPCMNGSKFAVYVSDNDWRRYHAWTESPMVHAYVALLTSSPLASALEEESLRKACSHWRAFPEGFQYDNPYVCGKAWTPRIADIVLLRIFAAPSPKPLKSFEVEERLRGVRRKRDVNLLTHSSAGGSFRSFFWGPGPVVRHIEDRKNAWMLLPWEGSYRPAADGRSLPQDEVVTRCGQGEDWFWVMRYDELGRQEAFVSLPDESVVMMNRVPGAGLSGAESLDICVLVEKPHDALTIHYQGGKAEYRPGDSAWRRSDHSPGLEVTTPWINLADRMGYAVVNLSGVPFRMVLPPAGSRGRLSLFHIDAPGENEQGLITVAFPNATHEQTSALSKKVTGRRTDNLILCRTSRYSVWANFSDREAIAQAAGRPSGPGSLRVPPNSVGFVTVAEAGQSRISE